LETSDVMRLYVSRWSPMVFSGAKPMLNVTIIFDGNIGLDPNQTQRNPSPPKTNGARTLTFPIPIFGRSESPSTNENTKDRLLKPEAGIIFAFAHVLSP